MAKKKAKKKAPAWDSKKMQRSIRRHDKKFEKPYKPKGGLFGWLRGRS